MITARPQTQLPVVRQLADHTDPTTYYVRATVFNSVSNEQLAQFALANQGNRRFATNYQTPGDSSGQGYYISILSEVFTDVNYSVKASTYGDEISTYQIIDQRQALGGFGGGGGSTDIDYKKVRQIVKDVVDEKFKNFKLPDPVDLTPVMEAIERASAAVKAIKIPEVKIPKYEPTDLKPILELINRTQEDLLRAVQDIPGRDKNDIQPLVDAIAKLDLPTVEQTMEEAVANFQSIMDGMEKFVKDIPGFTEKLDDLMDDFKDILYNMTVAGMGGREATKPKKKTVDTDGIARLSSKLLTR